MVNESRSQSSEYYSVYDTTEKLLSEYLGRSSGHISPELQICRRIVRLINTFRGN